MLGFCAACSCSLGNPADNFALFVSISVEAVDADNRVDSGFPDNIDQVDHVLAALLDQFDIFLGVGVVQRFAGNNLGSAAMHLQGTYCRCQYGDVGFKARVPAFDVPELLKTDISRKAGFSDIVIKKFKSYAVSDNRRLSDSDVGKRPGMDKAGVILCSAHKGRVDCVAHECCHGIAHFQVATGHRLAAFVKGNGDVVDTFFQVGKVGGN